MTRALGLSLLHPSGLPANETKEQYQRDGCEERTEGVIDFCKPTIFLALSPNGTTCRNMSHLSFLVLLQIRTLFRNVVIL